MSSKFKNLVFLDIETVSGTKEYSELNPRLQECWGKKALQLDPNCENVADAYFQKAAIYAEFGKIITIGIGFLYESAGMELNLRVKALSNVNEKQLLSDFCQLVEKGFPKQEISLCAHNGKEFDFPYLCRRMLINGIQIPEFLNFSGKKPWEVKHFDTMEMWKFGDRKSYTSLELLATVFDIETSKNGIDGSKVNSTFYLENDLNKIEEYCKLDVVVLAQLFLKMSGSAAIKNENIFIV